MTLETLESGGPVAPVKTAEAEGGAAAETIGTSDGGHSEVRTSGGHGGPVSRDSVSETSEEQPSSAATTAADSETRSAVSPTLSAESLLSDGGQPQTVSLGGELLGEVSDEVLQSSQKTSSIPSSSSSSTPSIVISIPSMSSSMSSKSVSSILPSAPTTSAPEEIVTTNPIADEDLELYETVALTYSQGDVRSGQPSTVKISPSSATSRMELTTPAYHRANPNRMGILDGESEDSEDHFLSLRAPHTPATGGPLNQARSKDDGMEKSHRRAEPSPGPDISDILSGLLNVVGEGLSIATNYVQENNKKKLQEKVSSSEILDEDEKKPSESGEEEEAEAGDLKRNRTRVNNRGPPLLSNIPFEAIPLEVLSQQRPGARPGVAIPQRPFVNQLPPGISGPPPPQPAPTSSSGAGAALPAQLPTRPDFVPDFQTEFSNTPEEPGAGAGAGVGTGVTEYARPGSAAVSGAGIGRPNTLRPPADRPAPAPASNLTQAQAAPTKETSTKGGVARPPLQPVPTDPFIDLLLNEIKEGRLTTAPPTSTSPAPQVDLQPSFAPSLLVPPPPPSTPRARPRPTKYTNRRPWPGGRPPRPQGSPPPPGVKKYPGTQKIVNEWKYRDKVPPSARPTPPLATRPLVFPSSTSRYRGQNGAIVTGVAIPAGNDVFDLTVTAQQGFGGSRKTKNKFRGECRVSGVMCHVSRHVTAT